MRLHLLFFSFVVFAQEVFCFDDYFAESLFLDLELVEKIDCQLQDLLPTVVNYQLQGGYFTMPSARTFSSGTIGLGFSYVPPYHIWGLAFQFFDHVEATGNYWVYKGMCDEIFGYLGFGDSADRTASLKFILLNKKDFASFLPNFAIGWNDFMGTCRFKSFYVVATQEFLKLNFEATLGWGHGRIQGFYGGIAWSPFRRRNIFFLKDLTLISEYDANDYKHHHHEHPKGRRVNYRINFGLQYRFCDLIHLSGSRLRGEKYAGCIALNYNLGNSLGFVPKIYNPSVYCAPVDTQPIGPIRSCEVLAQDLVFAFKEQGFDLYDLYLVAQECGKDILRAKVVNVRYREEEEVRKRFEFILASLVPSNISKVILAIETEGILVQEYHFRRRDLIRFKEGRMGKDELRVIAPPQEATRTPNEYEAALLYQRHKRIWVLTFHPWFRSFLGSSRGKFKYETGILLNQEGYLFNQFYYNITTTYTVKSSTSDMQSHDLINPSRMINVRTDSILYNQSNSFHLDRAYIQKSWNLGKGWLSRIAIGYFECAYAGLAFEALYYPVRANWAVGFEAATFLKRKYYGIGFQRKVRKFTSNKKIFVPFTGLQYFVDFYYQYPPLSLDFKFSAGQFLARDKGVRIDGGRIFKSGLRVGLWITLSNAEDRVNGDRYYDKGFSITMPLDLFFNKSSRTRVGYSMAAWLRDCGAIGSTGKNLYPTLFWERYNYGAVFY